MVLLSGDPDAPSDGPCRRCRRESRDCVFTARPGRTFTRTDPDTPNQQPSQPLPDLSGSTSGHYPHQAPHYPPPPPPAASWAAQELYSPSNPSLSRPLPPSFPEPPLANPYYGHPPPILHQPPTLSASAPSFHRTASGNNVASNVPSKHARDEYSDEDEDEEAGEEEDGDGDESGEVDDSSRRKRRASGSKGGQGGKDSDVLLSSTLHNPSDALRLLATASSLRSSAPAPTHGLKAASPLNEGAASQASGSGPEAARGQEAEGGWTTWTPVVEGLLTQPEAEVLFSLCVLILAQR